MIEDTVSVLQELERSSLFADRATAAFLQRIEDRFSAKFVRNTRSYPLERPDLIEPLSLAKKLADHGILHSLHRVRRLPDEPHLFHWIATCNDGKHSTVAGASFESDAEALYPMLAEGLERYLWATDSYFQSPIEASAGEMQAQRQKHIAPEQFTSFSELQRMRDRKLSLDTNARYLWIKSASLISNTSVYVPAQCATGIRNFRTTLRPNEPTIRHPITTGLATWPTRGGARVRGMLEIIERDAYMITWLNKITPARIALEEIDDPLVHSLLQRCTRYGLHVHALRLVTDAPTYAICVVVEDKSGLAPRWGVGLKAAASLPRAIQKALSEALRARAACRLSLRQHGTESPKQKENVGHYDRLRYWAHAEHAEKMAFLVQGEISAAHAEPWDHDDDAQHLARLLSWCRQKNYACVSVPIGISKLNPTSWHVELVVMPDLQPTYLEERFPQWGGTRLASVPPLFGFEARKDPYDEPHPFA